MKHHHPALAAECVGKSFMTTMSDEVLIAMIAAHDHNAMRALFLRHSVRIFRFLAHILGDAATADDLVSEVFIEVWRSAGRFEARSKVSTWILAIARYKAASARRRKSFDQLEDSAAESIEDPLDDPEVAAERKKRGAILLDCLKQLSPAHRETLDLIYYHEQSIAEVAQITGVSENTVKTRAFYARKQMAQLMAARGIESAAL
jgi:RNA polymerase sigma-70 factor, ECF subfamily